MERGQRTTIRFGGVRCEVSLVKASAKPKAAQHETRRVAAPNVSGPARPALDPFAGEVGDRVTGRPYAERMETPRRSERLDTTLFPASVPADAFEQREAEAIADRLASSAVEHDGTLATSAVDPLGEDLEPVIAPGGVLPHEPTVAPPATTVQQGVHVDGRWIDLTEQLREVDERTRLDGLEVVATIAQAAVLRERVRDAHYIAGVKPAEYPVLALMWHGLREADRAAAVVWTKKTAQALGFVVARGTLGEDAHLVLLELEWAENMRGPGPRALGPIRSEVSTEQRTAALELVDAFAAPPSALNELRDMRLAKRAELLELAREGRLSEFVAPPVPRGDVAVDDLAAAFAESAAALR